MTVSSLPWTVSHEPSDANTASANAVDEEAAAAVCATAGARRGRRSRATAARGRCPARSRSPGSRPRVPPPPAAEAAIVGTTRLSRSATNVCAPSAGGTRGRHDVVEERSREQRSEGVRARERHGRRGFGARRRDERERQTSETASATVSVKRISVERSICPASTSRARARAGDRQVVLEEADQEQRHDGHEEDRGAEDVRELGRENVGREAEQVAAGERRPGGAVRRRQSRNAVQAESAGIRTHAAL